MFTGIVESLGRVVSVLESVTDRQLTIEDPRIAAHLFSGASVALDGVCQTVTSLKGDRFKVHAMQETLRVTTLGSLRVGSKVNLETPVGAGEPMGGHFVQGHVDGIGTVVVRKPVGEAEQWRFSAPTALVQQMVPKGSVAVDGISLTVGPDLREDSFEVFLIPHTLVVTTLGEKSVGDRVNLETDILAKYLERYLRPTAAGDGSIGWETLRRTGFAD